MAARAFSSTRVPWPLEPTAFAAAVDGRRGEVIDLAHGDPFRAGLAPDGAEVLGWLHRPGAFDHAPDPAGARGAREAIARYYADHGAEIDPDDVVLTASTSEGYTHAFKVLCEPGDRIAAPEPSYPLIEHLATLESVELASYALSYDGTWHLDLPSVRTALDAGARALVVVQPSNPVGAVVAGDERARLVELCAEREVTLLVDEVFLDYASAARTFAGETGASVIVLSGLSKVAALPQLKCGWMVTRERRLRERLVLVQDMFLSVNGPVQAALPEILAGRHGTQMRIRERVARNRGALLARRPPDAPWDVLSSSGGWYAVLRLPRTEAAETVALRALEAGCLVHPGYLYDLPEAHLVVSLLAPPEQFDDGIARLSSVI